MLERCVLRPPSPSPAPSPFSRPPSRSFALTASTVGHELTPGRTNARAGLRIADHFGNFFQRNVTDLEFGTLDADKAIAAKLKHEGKLDDKVDAYFQCASLYTSATGERRVRVHNLAVPVSSLISSVFRAADMDTTIAFFTKECASRSLPRRRRRCLEERAEADLFPSSRAAITVAAGKTLRQVRESLSDSCAKALLAYRKHCASSTSPAQLILPESFKLFPLYALALMKTKALKGGVVASDVRTWAMRQLKSAGVPATVRMLYPRMLAVHQFADEVGFPDERGQLILPPLMRTSYSRMEPHGAYLVENGEKAFLWLGASVSPQILQDLYGVENLDELDTRMVRPCSLPRSLSQSPRTRTDLVAFSPAVGPAQPPDPALGPAAQHHHLLRVAVRHRVPARTHRAAKHRRHRVRVLQHARRGLEQRAAVVHRLLVPHPPGASLSLASFPSSSCWTDS